MISATPPVYLSLSSTNYVTSNSEIEIGSIGESNDQALVCHTDLSTTAGGEWLFPNGSFVPPLSNPSLSDSNTFLTTTNTSVVRLHAKGITTSLTGTYCCVIHTSRGERTFCANLGEY